MDLRSEEERFLAGQRSGTCSVVLKTLAVIGVGVALAVLIVFVVSADVEYNGLITACAFVFVFWTFVMAGLLWAVAGLVRSQRHIEENTREAAKTLERIAESMTPGKG